MKEDYLWNKTGSDAGIEKLERELAAFRYRTNEPPALPAKVLSLPEKRSYRFLKLGFAVVFVPSFVFILLGLVWTGMLDNKPDGGASTIVSESQKNISEPRHESPSTSSPAPVPVPARIQRKATAPIRAIKAGVRRLDTRNQPEHLTQEEKYAYSQLMLALSITSKELSIVRDKINGREERTAADDREK